MLIKSKLTKIEDKRLVTKPRYEKMSYFPIKRRPANWLFVFSQKVAYFNLRGFRCAS